MIKKLIWFIYLLITITVIISCKKDIIDVYIEVLPNSGPIFEQDTIQVRYTVHGANADSVSLFVNSTLIESQSMQNGIFFCKIDTAGYFTFNVRAYKSGQLTESKPVSINISELKYPELRYQISRIDDEPTYFIGEQLKITVLPRWEYMDINDFKKVTLYYEDKALGTKTSPPFIFVTPIIEITENNLVIELTDENNRIHKIPYLLSVAYNTPPEIEILDYNNLGTILSTSLLTIRYSGNDNVNVEYIELYINQQYHSTHIINSSYFHSKEIEIDSLQAGDYEIHCIAYDDRNEYTISNTYKAKISKTIILDYEIVDTEYTDDNSLVYAVSEYKLLIINPVEEIVSQYLDLPFLRATSLDYEPINKRLYIGFDGGEIIYWDNSTESFITIAEAAFPSIEDIEVEHSTNMAAVICNEKIYAFNITTKTKKMGNIDLEEKSTLTLNRNNNRIVVGGTPSVSSNRFDKFALYTDSLYHEASSSFGGYTKKIIMNPIRDEFLRIKNGSIGVSYPFLYDLNIFGAVLGSYQISSAQTASFSADGSLLYAGTDLYDYIYVFDSEDFSVLSEYYIPLPGHNRVNHIIPTTDNSRIVLTTNDVFYDYYKLIFLRLSD